MVDSKAVAVETEGTGGSPYYDNVRPLCYSDSDAVLLCFDISRQDIFDSGLKKWRTEILDFCPSTRILLIGCKTDLRTDVCTLMELSNQKQTPITHEQGSAMAKQLGAEAYLECSAFTSEKSIHSVFRTAALACINKLQPLAKPSPTRRLSKRLLHLPSKSELLSSTFKKEKAKSCSVMGVGSDCHMIDVRDPSSPPQRNTNQNKRTLCCPPCPEFFNSAYLFFQYPAFSNEYALETTDGRIAPGVVEQSTRPRSC
ncbi:Rho-related GTP-binding protein [Triplophysa tibetana]|uniref:Rho-related GTP-binding protein n=1 Tax=Triplophysa tibetana TaxID=1572043 RepID=A0A5A9NEC4_9TELE|nr:Rho-related GTP-binding protein [Triplophysa tibetana]